MNSAEIATRKSQLRMIVFLILSFFAGVFIIWQWVKTVRELDSLAADGSGGFKVLLPKGSEELTSTTSAMQGKAPKPKK